MPRKAAGLTAAKVRTAAPGRYGDGAGLYLLVRSPASRFWLFRYVRDGKMREMGLGTAAGPGAVTLADARVKARRLHDAVREGRDPLADRAAADAAAKAAVQQAQIRGKTFREVADGYLAVHEIGWRNGKHRQQWKNTLASYAYPHMGAVPVADVNTAHVMTVLEPIWRSKPETASRLRGRIESVLDYAKARGWRTAENAARWRGHVENMLPKRTKVRAVVHHAALPWRWIGAFMAELQQQDGIAALAIQFVILTASRTSEVINARWSEFDMQSGVWTVPATRMKAGREHRVPLSTYAKTVLSAVAPISHTAKNDGFVFPGIRAGKPLSGMAMLMLLRRMERGDLTVHGFRSTFRDWTAEATGYAREVAEAALAHTLGDKVEAAYLRGDLMEKRTRLMTDWAIFCARIESP
ncbi:MAG TPA: integrase arm-type DNA-binding domain-containing protein, partial [Acetobacteraceae bacterium]|nr:integrase arm-type DNA-binding domain-containing protein [Acetobacteraceae bacterium]